MDDAAQRSLLLWVQSFRERLAPELQVMTLVDLCDGVFLAKIMHDIDSEYVNMDLINLHAAGNWALKLNNIKTLLRSIQLFYHEELGQLCDTNDLIDANLIAKEDDVYEVAKLVELLLGCAVQGPSRSDYIHPIMQMDSSEQANMMHLIENLMRRFQMASPSAASAELHNQQRSKKDSFSYLNNDSDTIAQALEKASAMELKYFDMEREKRELYERFESLYAEKNKLADLYALLEEERNKLLSERQSTLARDNKKIQQIVESEIHALTLQLEEKNDELQRVKQESNERLMILENEVRRQADELDISRSKLGQLTKLEASVTKYKKKLEDMNTIKQQNQDLELQNAQLQDKILDLESTIKTVPPLKALMEKYKNQVVELQTANVEATSNIAVKEQKVRKLQEELDSALGGKEFLESQVEELRNQVTNLQQHNEVMDDDYTSTGTNSGTGGLSADVLLGRDATHSLRDRIARLERENAELRSGKENAEEIHLANELDLALRAKEALQEAMFQLKKQNEQLADELRFAHSQNHRHIPTNNAHVVPQPTPSVSATLHEAATAPGIAGTLPSPAPGAASELAVGSAGSENASAMILASKASSAPETALAVQTSESNALSSSQVAEYEALIEKLRRDVEAVDSMRATVTELTNRLKDKESVINELSEQRTKLENYTKKTLHAVQTKYMVAVSSHRNQINEKQERVDFLEKKMKEMRTSFSREQALMMSSFYEIGTEMQRRTMMPQGPGQGAGSWLASKRSEERAKRRHL